VINHREIYKSVAVDRFWELFFEIEFAYSRSEWDLVRDRIADFERSPVGAALLADTNISVSDLWGKYSWERRWWARGQLKLVS
jgi:hypothetical protein